MIDLAIAIGGGFVAMLFFSRIFRWLISFVLKGATLSVVSDLLTVVLGSTAYVYKTTSDGGDPQHAIALAVLGYGMGGLIVLVLDLFFDARAASKGETR